MLAKQRMLPRPLRAALSRGARKLARAGHGRSARTVYLATTVHAGVLLARLASPSALSLRLVRPAGVHRQSLR